MASWVPGQYVALSLNVSLLSVGSELNEIAVLGLNKNWGLSFSNLKLPIIEIPDYDHNGVPYPSGVELGSPLPPNLQCLKDILKLSVVYVDSEVDQLICRDILNIGAILANLEDSVLPEQEFLFQPFNCIEHNHTINIICYSYRVCYFATKLALRENKKSVLQCAIEKNQK
jgi:hypothetical protein